MIASSMVYLPAFLTVVFRSRLRYIFDMDTAIHVFFVTIAAISSLNLFMIARLDHLLWRMWQRLRGRKLLFYSDCSGPTIEGVKASRLTLAVDGAPFECWG